MIRSRVNSHSRVRAVIRYPNFTCSIDSHSDKFGAKIRRAEMDRIPYMLVLGKNEVAEGKVSIRSRVDKCDEGCVSQAEAITTILTRIAEKALPAS